VSAVKLRKVRAYGARGAENLLVFGDNLAALEALTPKLNGEVRCAYLDPPYNTGRTFKEYADARSSDDWGSMMRPRLEAVRALLREDGSIFVQIDDNELAHLTQLMDEVFGAANRISTITIVRSAATGHKAINVGPVNVSDFLLVYAKDRSSWRYRPQRRVREGFDAAYSTWLENPNERPASWRFRPLRAVVAESLGYASTRAATLALGADSFQSSVVRHALARAEHVVRFAQPRLEAIGQAAQQLAMKSRASKDKVFVLERPGRPPFIVRGGNRILFLKDKVETRDGAPCLVEPLTNVWTDVPFQGMAREGGVTFSRNKKPERLLARILDMASDKGDWILDPFVGSGTTAAVAHKMGRRWIGIDSGAHVETLAEARLRRVVDGTDPTGITSATGFSGGGGFAVAKI
jgi:adenine-specific DNA-methyltransferase